MLIYFIILGVKINSNILLFLEINDENFISINLQNLILIDSIVKSQNFLIFSNLNLVDNLRNQLNELSEASKKENNSQIMKEDKEKITETIFENISFLKKGKGDYDFILAQTKFNEMLKGLKKLMDIIK